MSEALVCQIDFLMPFAALTDQKLDDDRGEMKNLAVDHAERVKMMSAFLGKLREQGRSR